MMYAIVVFKVDGDLPYEDVLRWRVSGNFVVLYRSRHEVVIIPADAVTSVEIRVDKEADRE